MANKIKPMPVPQAKPRPLTEEEKQAKILQFLQQKREQFSINILCNLCHGYDKEVNAVNARTLVDAAVDMADHLMEKLYPIKEEESK